MLAPDDPRHGTHNGYNNHGCRCGPCTKANTDSLREWKHKRGINQPMAEYRAWVSDPRFIHHGTESGYSRCVKRPGGACAMCKYASAKARRDRRNAMSDEAKEALLVKERARKRRVRERKRDGMVDAG